MIILIIGRKIDGNVFCKFLFEFLSNIMKREYKDISRKEGMINDRI